MKVSYTKAVIKDVKKLKDDKLIAKFEKLILEIKRAEIISEVSNLKKLKGHPTAYRVRIGDYRLGLYSENNNVILARFVKRNDIYKIFP